MLFDLQGRRRRVVQGTYLMLAVLMGGGLVLFGIGGDVSGGLVDAFKDDGGGSGNSAIEKRIERNEKRLAAKPGDERALKALVRDNYQLATAQTDSSSVGFPKKSRDELRRAGSFWQQYVKSEPEKVDSSLANVALQIYDVTALNKPKQALEAAQVIAASENNSPSYIRVVQYATLSSDTRTATLAGQKAIDLAPKAERKEVKAAVAQAKQPQAGATQQPTQPGQ